MARLSREGVVDPDSNYCFGEGGAGAYSDGKLYTRSKNAATPIGYYGFSANTAHRPTYWQTHIHI